MSQSRAEYRVSIAFHQQFKLPQHDVHPWLLRNNGSLTFDVRIIDRTIRQSVESRKRYTSSRYSLIITNKNRHRYFVAYTKPRFKAWLYFQVKHKALRKRRTAYRRFGTFSRESSFFPFLFRRSKLRREYHRFVIVTYLNFSVRTILFAIIQRFLYLQSE